MVDENRNSRGHTLSEQVLRELRNLISEKIDLFVEEDEKEIIDPDLLTRYAQNPQDPVARMALIEKIPDYAKWTEGLANKFGAKLSTIVGYVDNPEKLDRRIGIVDESGGRARALRGTARQVFVEGVRLLSTTMSDLEKCL